HVGVVDLAGVRVEGDRREPERAVGVLIWPAVVAEDDQVLVRPVGVVANFVARRGARVRDADPRRFTGVGALRPHPRPEGRVDHALRVIEGDRPTRVLVDAVANARVSPEEEQAVGEAATARAVVRWERLRRGSTVGVGRLGESKTRESKDRYDSAAPKD